MGKLLFITHGAFYLFKTDDEQMIKNKKEEGRSNENGAFDWTRTNDPHHVKVVL